MKTLVLAAAASLAVLTMAVAPAHATERWRVPAGIPTSLPGVAGLKDWAAAVNAMGGEDFQVKLYEPGELVPAFSVMDAVRAGKVPAGFHVLNYSAGTIPAAPLLTGAPFVLDAQAYASWYYSGGGKKMTQELLRRHGVYGMMCNLTGPETGGWFREPLESVDQLQGLKFRTAGLGGNALTKVGVSVSSIPLGETFPALEKGALDAAEASLPSVDMVLGLYKVANHAYFPGWHQPMAALHLVVNLDAWNNLTDKQRSIVENACDAVALKNLVVSDALQADAVIKAREAGVQTHEYSNEMTEVFRAATMEVLAEGADADADFKALLESMRSHGEKVGTWSKLGYVAR